MLICIHMLDKRANILFDESIWQLLASRSRSEKKSIGELVRLAVMKTYKDDSRQEKISKAIKTILAVRKRHKHIDYRKLIDYGRKY